MIMILLKFHLINAGAFTSCGHRDDYGTGNGYVIKNLLI